MLFYQFLCAFKDSVADFAFEGAYFNNNINNFIALVTTQRALRGVISLLRE
jgi:hypothetical protein